MTFKRYLYLLTVAVGLFSLFLGMSYINAFPKISVPKISDKSSVVWDTKINKPYVHKGSDGEVLLNLNLKGQEFTTTQRAPINLVLVIDRSGSMTEKGKLDYAKEAAKTIISGLGTDDRLSIVAYSTEVQVVYPMQFVRGKEEAISVVNSLYPTDSTNLSGGLITGIDQLKSVSGGDYVNRVILLSDGLANVGITDLDELSRIASNAAENGIHVTSMGLGLNYDEDLMMNIAEYGAGNYYFIESPNQLASIFQEEFGQLLQAVAKDPVIYISLAPGVKLSDVMGYSYSENDGEIRLNLSDLFRGQERDILIKLSVPTDEIGKHHLADATLGFTDLLRKKSVKLQRALEYRVTDSIGEVLKNEDKVVDTRGIFINSANDLYRATTEYENGSRLDAIARVKGALGRISEVNNSPHKNNDTVEQEAILNDALRVMEEVAPAVSSDSGKKIIKEYKAKARAQQK